MSFTTSLFHCVFATKGRRPLITKEMQPRLWSYLGGIARANGMKALAVGGIEDHVHLLLSLHPMMPIGKAMQLIKAGSSKWWNEQTKPGSFAWQEKYGAFSIGTSQVNATIRYINNQEKHHAKRGFIEELKIILKKNGFTLTPEMEEELIRP